MEGEKAFSYFFAGLLAGGFLGGVAGLLSAPKSGKELRSDIKETGGKTLNGAKEVFGRASEKISEVPQRAKDIFSCIKEKTGGTPRYAESESEFAGEA